MATHRKAGDFRNALNVNAARWEDKGVFVLNGIALRVLELATIGTRLRTGRARAGWAIAVGRGEDSSPPEGVYPSTPNGAIFFQKLADAPIGLSRFVFNNVDYVVWLEVGTKYTPGDWMLRKAMSAVQAAGLAS